MVVAIMMVGMAGVVMVMIMIMIVMVMIMIVVVMIVPAIDVIIVHVMRVAVTQMRGRHGLAILEQLGVTETVAANLGDYVSIAVRLAGDPACRAALRQQIAARKDRLYRDRECIRGLEAFLLRAAQRRLGDPL